MNEEQKVLKNQLQLAGIGIIIGVFGVIEDITPCIVIGICIFIYGMIRMIFLKKLLEKIKDSNE